MSNTIKNYKRKNIYERIDYGIICQRTNFSDIIDESLVRIKGENKIINYHQAFNLAKGDATDNMTVHIFTNKGEGIIIAFEKE